MGVNPTVAEPGIDRAALVAALVADPAALVVIEAPAGTGKSWVLAALARALGREVWRGVDLPETVDLLIWDVPAVSLSSALPSDLAARGGRVILAKRPETAIPGLARARVYGQVSQHGAAGLMFGLDDLIRDYGLTPEAAQRMFDATGGWPCLLPIALSAQDNTEPLDTFLGDDVLRPLASAQLVALEVMLTDPKVRVDAGLRRAIPFAASKGPLHPALIATRQPMLRALRELIAARSIDPQEARAIAVAQAALGLAPAAIATFQRIGAWQAALQALQDAGGLFFVFFHGPAALDRVLAGFPAPMLQDEEMLVHCRAIQAVKRGEVPLTRQILVDRYGPQIVDANAVIADKRRYSLDFRFLRLLVRIWEDDNLDSHLLESAYALLAELPLSDDLRRGSFYNAVLEFYLRDRRFAEAEHVATRAAAHYASAHVPVLSFYIALHGAVIRLFLGDPAAARVHAAAAAAHLAAARFDSPGDARLLGLLEACISYESGAAEPLARFLSIELDAFAQGEIWPSLVELSLIYGSQALGEHYSTIAARGFLDRWRVRQDQSVQFRVLIDLREIVVIQNGNRWQEAAQKAAALDMRISLVWVQSAGEALSQLHDRDEVAMALIWLRHMAQVMPGRAGLDLCLRAMLENPHLTARQRIGTEIWLAHVLRRQKQATAAEAVLTRTLAMAAALGSVAILGEERAFLTDLTASRRFRDLLARNDATRRVMRQVQESGPGRARRGRSHGLTRQEMRVLHAINEGAANKAIANMLGLSEATVKFHLANLYRKLGCKTRREAVAAAQALRLVA